MPRPIEKRKHGKVPGKRSQKLTPIEACLREPVVKRIARRAEVTIVSTFAYRKCRELLRTYLKGVLRDAILYCFSRDRKTISVGDAIHAIRNRGSKVVYSSSDRKQL